MSINLTIVIQLALFLIFLWGAYRMFYRPTFGVMDGRAEKMAKDQAEAESAASDAESMEAHYTRRLTESHQEASQRLHQAKYDAYGRNREDLDKLRARSDEEVAVCRADVAKQLEQERAKCAALLPGLVDAMDQQLTKKGTLV